MDDAHGYNAALATAEVQKLLVERLAGLRNGEPASAFVLLWTYFRQVGLQVAENALRRRACLPHRLALVRPVGFAEKSFIERYDLLNNKLSNRASFDVLGLHWLQALDHQLGNSTLSATGNLRGLDDRFYRVFRLNNYIAETLADERHTPTWAGVQGASLCAYTRHVAPVPRGAHQGLTLEPGSLPGYVSALLQAERVHGRLKIVLWPLATFLQYVGEEQWGEGAQSEPGPPLVSLAELKNEAEVEAEALRAVAEAAKARATLLIFPELAFTPAMEETVRGALCRRDDERYPILTVLGRCHKPAGDESGLDLNEAVILDPWGKPIAVHRKLTSFATHQEHGGVGERVQVGDSVSVFESAVGNLCVLICLDLFNEVVGGLLAESHANCFLVPSLSPKTNAHAHAAQQFFTKLRASTFVCNRALRSRPPVATGCLEGGSSFFHVFRKQNPKVLHWERFIDKPHLLFDLQDRDSSIIQ